MVKIPFFFLNSLRNNAEGKKKERPIQRAVMLKYQSWCNQLHLCRKKPQRLIDRKVQSFVAYIKRKKMICDVKENMDVVFQVSRTPRVDSKA